MSIKNLEELRDLLLENIENLADDDVDLQRAAIIAKSAEGVFSSVKLQLQYNGMRNEEPHIPFLQDCNEGIALKALNNKPAKALAAS